jgi:hypothetical protein
MEHIFKTKVNYSELGSKEQENFNYAKTAGILAEYGFSCSQITADKFGADMIAYHIATAKPYSIQLKGSRATLDRKYEGKDIWIAYIDRKSSELCLYHHDSAIALFEQTKSANSVSWSENGWYSGMSMHNHFNDIIIRLPFK